MFGALDRVVVLWGNDSFPGGSIGEHFMRGPAQKESRGSRGRDRMSPSPLPNPQHNTLKPQQPSLSAFAHSPELDLPRLCSGRALNWVRNIPRRCLPRTPHVHTHGDNACRNSWALITRHRRPAYPRSAPSCSQLFRSLATNGYRRESRSTATEARLRFKFN